MRTQSPHPVAPTLALCLLLALANPHGVRAFAFPTAAPAPLLRSPQSSNALPFVVTARAPTRALVGPPLSSSRRSSTAVYCTAGEPAGTRNITFGGGCFWCTEAVFQQLAAVSKVTPGYAGGTAEKPTYKQVVTGKTGHAEVVRVSYDPSKAELGDLLDLFFASHDPTTLNRQGADAGTQYRSIILFEDEEQKKAAIEAIARAEEVYGQDKWFGFVPGTEKKIVTQLVPMGDFWQAEKYHQDYYLNNPNAPYCYINISPKLQSFKVRSKVSAIGKAEGF